MEVRSAKFALLNRAAAAIDSYGSDGKERQHSQKDNNAAAEDEATYSVTVKLAGVAS